MEALQLPIVYILISCVFRVLILLPPEVHGIIRNVGQDVVFMWNRTSGSIDEVRWGIVDPADNQGVKPQFIYVRPWGNVVKYSADLDTAAASSYKGRVHYVGDVPAGRAWFKITNLSISDANEYAAVILEGSVNKRYEMSLAVAVTPKFQPQPPLTKNIAEGQDLSVPCTAVGTPTPNVKWVQIAGHVIKSKGTGGATLRIPNIRRDQNGTYECQASNNPNENPVTAQTVVSVYYSPQSSVILPSITVVQGHVIVLSCTADGYPPPSISWTKADGVIKDGHTVAGGTLRIPDAIKTDAGKYICTAKNTYDSREHTDSATATVIVKYQASIIFDKFINRTVNESDSLSIKCDADGNPAPTIKWKTPSGSVHNGNVYSILSVSRSHAGTYTCTASNGIGREAMASIQVTVQYKPAIDLSKSSLSPKSWNGNSIRLRCLATGLPAPRISWYKPTNQQITVGVNILPEGSEVTVLTTTDQGDYGQYKCRATNILGSDEHNINVTRLFTPGPVTITITEIEASSANVRWTKPADDGGRAVTGYLLETDSHIFVRTIDTYTVLTGLKKDTQYKVTVYAKNGIGYGVPSTKIITTKKTGRPDIPELLTSLLIEAESKRKVLLRWKKPDDNGATISRYTIYMKEESKQSDWNKIEDVKDSLLLEYIVGTTVEYGKTYKFTVTAWNKYGESIKDERNVKTVNTTADKTAYASGKSVNSCPMGGTKYITAVLGVIIAILVLSLGLNLLQFLWSRKKERLHCLKGKQGNQRTKKAADEEIYSNELEMDKKVVSAVTTSRPQPHSNTGPEYETIQQLNEIANPREEIPPNHPKHYAELNLPNTSEQGVQRPVYEPLRTKSVEPNVRLDDNNEQQPYEPLNIRNQDSTYQSLQTNSRESAI